MNPIQDALLLPEDSGSRSASVTPRVPALARRGELNTASSSDSPERVVHYAFLDGLRGATAAYVMVYHLLAWMPTVLPRWITRLQRPLSFGHVAVSIFIVLSGYSLGLPIARSKEKVLRGGLRGYIKRRAARILPAYFAALFIGLLLSATIGRIINPLASRVDLSFPNIVTHLLLIHNLWKKYELSINMAHWSVAAEWQIYFLLPLIFLPAWRRGTVALIASGLAVSVLPLLLLPKGHDLSWTCPWYAGLFTIGLAASSLERRQFSGQLHLLLRASIAFFVAVYLVVHFAFSHRVGEVLVEFIKDSLAGLAIAALLIDGVASARASRRSPVIKLLETRPLRELGRCSYSLYLVHCSVLWFCVYLASQFRLSDLESFALRAVLGIPLSLGAAAGLYLLFERPFLRHRQKVLAFAAPR